MPNFLNNVYTQNATLSTLNLAKNLICFDLPKNEIHNQTNTIEELSSFQKKVPKLKC